MKSKNKTVSASKKWQLPESLTTITPLSKTLALVLFILLPFIGFFLGVRYQQHCQSAYSPPVIINQATPIPTPKQQVYCTQDVKVCPDGSYVSREGPNCEFAPCEAL
jgi:hypothetical protein